MNLFFLLVPHFRTRCVSDTFKHHPFCGPSVPRNTFQTNKTRIKKKLLPLFSNICTLSAFFHFQALLSNPSSEGHGYNLDYLFATQVWPCFHYTQSPQQRQEMSIHIDQTAFRGCTRNMPHYKPMGDYNQFSS